MNTAPARCGICGSDARHATLIRENSYIEPETGMLNFLDLLKDGDSSTFLIEPVNMTKEEYDKAPEFTGF